MTFNSLLFKTRLKRQIAQQIVAHINSPNSSVFRLMDQIISTTPIDTTRCASNWRVKLPGESSIFNNSETGMTSLQDNGHHIRPKLGNIDIKFTSGHNTIFTFYNKTDYLIDLEYFAKSSQNNHMYTKACQQFGVRINHTPPAGERF